MNAGQLRVGICWECQNIDLDSIAYPTTPSQDTRPSSSISSHGVRTGQQCTVTWNSIRKDCSLCARIQAMFEVPSNANRKAFSRAHDDLEVTCDVKAGSHEDVRPRYLRFTLWGISTYTCFQVILIVPETVARRVRAEQPVLERIKRSITNCEIRHTKVCSNRRQLRLSSLRIIDCARKQLCYIFPGTAYACLSYVWGASGTDISWDPENLPKTIDDAISVVLQLDLQYLWVDRYCIDQEDSPEKHYLIQNMGSIYQCAKITIIAGSGNNPDEGLPGINGTYRPQQETFLLSPSGKRVVAVNNPEHEISNSTWITRGWTCQELHLSRRIIVFTETQVYYQCTGAEWLECLRAYSREDVDSGVININDDDVAEFTIPFRVFLNQGLYYDPNHRASDYYGRHLSFKEDILNASIALFGSFDDPSISGRIGTHFYGLPIYRSLSDSGKAATKTFARSLSWVTSHDHYLYKSSHPPARLFPSWSWASVKEYHHPNYAGNLDFSLYAVNLEDLYFQDDICIWLTPHTIDRAGSNHNQNIRIQSGDRIEIDCYLSTRSEAGDYTNFKPSFHIQAWIIPCRVHGTTLQFEDVNSHKSVNLTVLQDGWLSLDRSHQSETSELIAVLLGAMKPFTDGGKATFLIAGKVQESTYQRVGLFNAHIPVSEFFEDVDSVPTRDHLEKIKPGGLWELRTIEMV